MFYVTASCSRPESCVRGGGVMTLDRCDVRVIKVAQHLNEPIVLQHDVLIDLADDRMGRFLYPGVDRRRGAPAAAVHQAQHYFALQLLLQPRRASDATVID